MIIARRRPGLAIAIMIGVIAGITLAYWPYAGPVLAAFVLWRVWANRKKGRRQFARFLTLSDIYALPPERFEQYVSALLKRLSWTNVQWIGSPGDLGADVTGVDPEGRKCVVQAKRYHPSTSVGSPVVQALLGSQTIYHADRAVLVTTGRFTPAATDLAAMMDVVLVDGERLVWLSQASERVGA